MEVQKSGDVSTQLRLVVLSVSYYLQARTQMGSLVLIGISALFWRVDLQK